jgi:hypothetical protein
VNEDLSSRQYHNGVEARRTKQSSLLNNPRFGARTLIVPPSLSSTDQR